MSSGPDDRASSIDITVSKTLALRLWQYSVFVLVLGLVITPVFFLLFGSFSTALLPTDFSLLSLGFVNYIKVYGDPARTNCSSTPRST